MAAGSSCSTARRAQDQPPPRGSPWAGSSPWQGLLSHFSVPGSSEACPQEVQVSLGREHGSPPWNAGHGEPSPGVPFSGGGLGNTGMSISEVVPSPLRLQAPQQEAQP